MQAPQRRPLMHAAVRVSVWRSTDALSDARMVTGTGALMLAHGLHPEVSAVFFLIQGHQAVFGDVVVGPNGSRGVAPWAPQGPAEPTLVDFQGCGIFNYH